MILPTLLLMTARPALAPVADRLGVCFHLNESDVAEFPKMKAEGFSAARTDLPWGEVEPKPGTYRWKKFDTVVAALRAAGIHPLLVLDGPNPAYGPDSPRTDETRAAFAKFAGLAAARYKDSGVDYEIWNEPHHPAFWKPAPSADDYVALVKVTAAAIHAAAPDAHVLGLACDPLNPFAEACFKLGMLDSLDAVSIHPYRPQRPESLLDDLARFKALIAQYSPTRSVGLEISEMGYPMSYPGQDETRRAGYDQRAFLVSLLAGIDRFYVYQWKEKVYPGEHTHGFGLHDETLAPLPASLAFASLMASLKGYDFEKRVSGTSPDDYVLSFVKGSDHRYIAWTARRDPVDGNAVNRNPAKIDLAAPATVSLVGQSIDLDDTPKVVNEP